MSPTLPNKVFFFFLGRRCHLSASLASHRPPCDGDCHAPSKALQACKHTVRTLAPPAPPRGPLVATNFLSLDTILHTRTGRDSRASRDIYQRRCLSRDSLSSSAHIAHANRSGSTPAASVNKYSSRPLRIDAIECSATATGWVAPRALAPTVALFTSNEHFNSNAENLAVTVGRASRARLLWGSVSLGRMYRS